jgi:hypothetical protein
MPVFCDYSQTNRTAENGLVGTECDLCPGSSPEGTFAVRFPVGLRRMQCDQRSGMRPSRIDFCRHLRNPVRRYCRHFARLTADHLFSEGHFGSPVSTTPPGECNAKLWQAGDLGACIALVLPSSRDRESINRPTLKSLARDEVVAPCGLNHNRNRRDYDATVIRMRLFPRAKPGSSTNVVYQHKGLNIQGVYCPLEPWIRR